MPVVRLGLVLRAFLIFSLSLAVVGLASAAAGSKLLKVFILAGQSMF